MRRHQLIFSTLLILLLIVPIYSAIAADQLPPPDPEGTWRVITQDPATTTSKCIGDTSTPVCAMETALACFTRHEMELCRKSMVYDFKPKGSPLSRTIYHIYHTECLTSQKNPEPGCRKVVDAVPDYIQPTLGKIAPPVAGSIIIRVDPWGDGHFTTEIPGDIEILANLLYCHTDEICSSNDSYDSWFIMRKTGQNWKLTYWSIGDDEAGLAD